GGVDVPVHYESALVTKDGRRIQVETSIRPLTAEGPRRLLAVVRDVTDRHRSEAAERESETRFRTLFAQSQAGMAFADLNGRLTSTNEAFRQLVGYTDAELQGVSVLELTHPEDLPLSEEVLRLMLAGETPGYRIDKRYVRKDGQSVWVDVAARMVRDPKGKALYIQTVAIDIRDRMRGEVLQSARFAVTQALVTSPGWGQAAPHVLEGLCRALDWELGEYWEVDANRESMHFSTAWKRPGRDTDRRVRGEEARRGGAAGEREADAIGAGQRVRRPGDARPDRRHRSGQPRGHATFRLRGEGAGRPEDRGPDRDHASRLIHELR